MIKRISFILLCTFIIWNVSACKVPSSDGGSEQTAAPVPIVQNEKELDDSEKESDQSSDISVEDAPKDAPQETESDSEKIEETAPIEENKNPNQEPAVPILSDSSVFTEFQDLKALLTLEDHVVFRGIKTETLPSFYNQDGGIFYPISIKVLTPLYGDVQTEDILTMYEIVGKHQVYEDYQLIMVDEEIQQVEDDTEYIFILEKKTDESTAKTYYSYVAKAHSFTKIADQQRLAEKVQAGSASDLEKFQSSVLNHCLENPDTKIDLYKEALKYIGNLNEKATSGEILNLLPSAKKELFQKMIQQYGIK